jgi:peptidoglycan/LPS O-acetylase OafA/YrhL
MKADIPALTGLRGVAALWVFLFHLNDALFSVDRESALAMMKFSVAGYMGVDIFFVLSGFILAYNYAHHDLHRNVSSYASFLWKRLARIYPVHIAALMLLVVLQFSFQLFDRSLVDANRLTVVGLIASLSLTHGWSIPIDRTWNVVSWSISCEWLAYLAFPLIAAMASRFRSPAPIVAALALMFSALASIIHFGWHEGSLAYGLPRICIEFPAGVLLHRLWQIRGFQISSSATAVAAGGFLILIGGGNALGIGYEWSTPGAWLPASACFIVYGIAAGGGLLVRLLRSRLMLYCGRISFSFYMIHLLVLGSVKLLLTTAGLSGTVAAVTLGLASFSMSVLTAAALFHWVEVPMRGWMLSIWRRRSVRRTSQSVAPDPSSTPRSLGHPPRHANSVTGAVPSPLTPARLPKEYGPRGTG